MSNWENIILEFIMKLDEQNIPYDEGLFLAHQIADDLVEAARSRESYAR